MGRFLAADGIAEHGAGIYEFIADTALDGGHILFIGIEAVTRRKLSENFSSAHKLPEWYYCSH